MDFDGDFGLWQRNIAEGLEGTARRLAVFEALAVRSGQAILDLGCGGGHLVRDLGSAVGVRGRVVGLDASPQQLESAAELCSALPWVELIEADATDLPFENASFDSIASIQMLEYVEDVDKALLQARRVLRSGGKVALVSVLWDHWCFHGAEAKLNRRMHDVWRAHCPHQMLPMEMRVKLEAAGFSGAVQKPLAFLNTNMHDNAFALWASKLVASFAMANGVVQKDAERWVQQLKQADREGRFGFVSVPVLSCAIAI